MKRGTGVYSLVLTSVVCILGGQAFAAPAVRMLGGGTKTVSGGTSVSAGGSVNNDSKPGASTTAVSQTARASSLRFTPSSTSNKVSVQSGAGLVSNADNGSLSNGVSINGGASPSARLSIGKYLNLSHSTGVVPGGGGTGTGGGATGEDVEALRSELDALRTQVDRLEDGKQNALIVGDGDYIEITGSEDNVISIDIDALKNDLQTALGTDKAILTEIDDDYKLWWCYANSAKTGCDAEKQMVLDLGSILNTYDLANNNVSLSEALAGKQGVLSEADNGFIEINQETGKVGVRFDALKDALNIADNKSSEIRYDAENGKLQWRYSDEYETDGVTRRWNTADIGALMRQGLENYVQVQTLEDYVKKTELAGLQGALTASETGFLKIENNQIGVKFDDLKDALEIPAERAVEVEFDNDGKIQWRYAGNTDWNKTNKKISDFVDLSAYVLKTELAGLQGALTASDTGYLEINNNQIGIKFEDLKAALEIPAAQKDIEMEITSDGVLRWRYLDAFEADGTTKKWTNVSENINTLIETKLAGYATLDDLSDLQLAMSTDANGYLEINGDTINVKFDKLKQDLQIPAAQKDIEMEITSDGILRWRYLDVFEADGETKKWTDVSVKIGDLIDGKLESYVSNTALMDTLNNYITSGNLSTELENYATKTYVDNGLATKQVKLTESEGGFISISPIDGSDGEIIGLKYDDLKDALRIDGFRTSEMRVQDGKLQWRYTDEFETDAETGNSVAKWTTVYDLTSLLDDWVTTTDFNVAINRIDSEMAGKQIKLTPAADGYILLNESGEIAVDMEGLRRYLAIEGDNARTSEIRVFDGKLQWRYLDEYETDGQGNQVESWHVLDLSTVELPLYVEKTYLWNNYYNKTYVDNLARTIENNINVTLENLWPDEGLYLLDVTGTGDSKTHVWRQVQIVDGDGIVH